MKLCVRNEDKSNSNLEERIENLEKKIGNSKVVVQENKEKEKPKVQKSEIKQETKVQKGKAINGKPVDCWINVLENLKKNGKLVLYTNLLNSKAIEINDLTLGIQFAKPLTGFAKTVLEAPDNRKDIETAIALECGKQMNIKYIVQENNSQDSKAQNSNSLADLGIPINIIEE